MTADYTFGANLPRRNQWVIVTICQRIDERIGLNSHVMSPGPTPAINIPPEEVKRQAEAALLGYGYQLYQTASAWLRLKPSELLHVEFAEDFAVSDDGTLKLTQVKNTKATLGLRSKAVAALIRAVWTFQIANPGRSVVAALITTGRIGRERGLAFPGKLSGLSYWRVAAREQADVEPMRAALLGLDLPKDLRAFLKDATADEIRERILRPVHWFGSGQSQDEIERDLHEQLVHFGNAQGVGAQDSKNALNALIVELLASVRRPAESRHVTAADLLTLFQKNTYRLVPPSVFQGAGRAATRGLDDLNDVVLATRDAASTPLPPRAALRSDLIEDLHSKLVESGALWLHGSSGLGKTTLALLLARRQNAAWSFADLRGSDPRPLRLILARLSTTFGPSGARGLILDDLPSDVDNATILAVKRVARAVENVDGVLVVTSSRPPPPTLASGLALAKGAVRSVPYLTEDDVGQIVSQAGGDRRTWGRIVFGFCAGHPQLVDARVMGLRSRGWPTAELADIAPLRTAASDLEDERTAVRTRLLRELDVGSRELLLRLSLLVNNFDRTIMFATSGVPPAVAHAGILFDALVGPWIEQVGPARYRISPLLKESGEAGLTEAQRTSIRTAVVDYLMTCRPFPADQLMQVFIFAYVMKHIPALTWFSGALMHASSRDKNLFKRLAEEVSVFAIVDRSEGELLIPEDVNVSTKLRYAQFRVAIAIEDGKRAAIILDRLLSEIDHLAGASKESMQTIVLGTALIERLVPLAPKRWLSMLETLIVLPSMRSALRQRPKRTDPLSGLTLSASSDEMMFINRATALDGIDQLWEFVEAVDALSETDRDRYLSAASNLLQSNHHIVASAWLSAVRVNGFDGKTAAAKMADLYTTASRWKNADMAIELSCAQAVMLDEYSNDKDSALKVLEVAQGKYPQDYRINRQRQKVFYRNGDHALALAEFESFANALPRTNPVDQAFAMREAGRSAAEIGDLDKTRVFFEQAWEAARGCGEHMRPLTAGLSADCAILDFKAGKTDNALALMLRALEEAELIDPKAGLKEHYTILILTAAILWMRGGSAGWPVERQAMVVGMCSNPDPLAELKERPLPQPLLPWYELAELEADVSEHQFALTALRQRTTKCGLLPMETLLATSLLEAAVRKIDVDRFIEALAVYPRGVVEGVAAMRRRDYGPSNMPTGLLKPISAAEWGSPSIKEATASAVLMFMLTAVCSGRRDVADELRERLTNIEGLGASLEFLFRTISVPVERRDDLIEVSASFLGRMQTPGFVFDAADAFRATVYFVQLAAAHVLGEAAAGPIFKYFADVWRDILANRTFSVRSPAAASTFIFEALSKGETNRAKLAHLVLASEVAVRSHLGAELKANIRALTEPRKKLLSEVQA